MLAQRFEHEVAPAILRARAAAPPEDKSLGGRALAALKSLVVVRRVDSRDVDAASHPVEAAVDTAAAALRKNDLAGAVKALGALQGAPAEAAAPWLAEARERLHVDAAVARVTEMVAQHFSPPASPAPTAPPSPAAESPSR
jgi:hypothetical protein